MSDQNTLQTMAVSFYGELYRENNPHRLLYTHRDCFPAIDAIIAGKISSQFTPDVRIALFSMKPWKAPGVDGIQVGFYQRHWEVVGKDFCLEILSFLEGGVLDSRMNKTMICLIPKVEAPTLLS